MFTHHTFLAKHLKLKQTLLTAHARRASALRHYKEAKSPTQKQATEAELKAAQARLTAVKADHTRAVRAAPYDPNLRISSGVQKKLAEFDKDYAAYDEKLKKQFQERAKLLTLQQSEKARLDLLRQNRQALTSALNNARRGQRANANANTYREYRANYILSHRFYVEIGGVIRAAFNECSGFGLDVKKEQYLEGGVNDQQRVLLGHAEFQDTVLKRGMTNDPSFWLWMKEILVGRSSQTSGQTAGASLVRNRRNINILMMNQAGAIMQVCTLIGAVPISWKAPAFQADSTSVAIEEMTLAYEGVNLQFHTADASLGAGGASSQLQRDILGFFPEK